MRELTGLSRVLGANQGNPRTAGGQSQAESFQRAMQEHDDGTAAEQEPDPPMRRGLQQNPGNGRKLDSEACHVDVVA